jgi:hypothetical protein
LVLHRGDVFRVLHLQTKKQIDKISLPN